MVAGVIIVGGDVVGWVEVHGVPQPRGGLVAVWRLVAGAGAVASRVATAGGSLRRESAQGWAVVTDRSVLPVLVTGASETEVWFRLAMTPELGTWVLDVSPWSLAQVLGPATAAALTQAETGTRVNLVARVLVVQNLGGGYVRHIAPGVGPSPQA